MSQFIKGLIENNLELLKKVQKGEFHNHSGLGLRFDTFNAYAKGKVKTPKFPMDGLIGLDDYIFGELVKHVPKKEDSQFLFRACIEEAIKEGISILEPSIDCHELSPYDNYQEFFDFLLKLKDEYKNKIDFRPEVGIAKSSGLESIEKYLIPAIESGVYNSIDLYGQESIDNFEVFREVYKYAKDKGMKLKAHAGEFTSSENVYKAITLLDLDEIQHGIRAVDDKKVLSLIKDKNIRLNICPSSNILLGGVKDIKNHPIREIVDFGIRVSINTDDLLIFDSGINEEYLLLYKNGVLGVEELEKIRLSTLEEE